MNDRRSTHAGAAAGAAAVLVGLAVFGAASIASPGLPFPPLGIGQRVLRLIPGPLASGAIELLGHWALRGFVAGVLVAAVALGAGAGILVARRPPGSRQLTAGLAGGGLGLLALAGWSPDGGGISITGYLLLVLVAAVAFTWTLTASLASIERAGPEGGAPDRTRRELLKAGGGAVVLLGVAYGGRRVLGGFGGGGGGAPLVRPAGAAPVAPAPAAAAETAVARAAFDLPGLAAEVTSNRDHYTVDESIIDPDVDAGSWRLRIDGLVGRPVELTYDELMAMASVERVVTLTCISNLVGGDLISTARWTGVPLRDVLARAGGPGRGAQRVVFHAVGGYSDSLAVAKAVDEHTLIAYGMNGTALPRGHGYPARVIAPGIYGMKNVKWLERIEVVDDDYQGYWQKRGWDNLARIKTGSRIDVPAGGDPVRGAVTVAGVAWAGDRGISRVEVSADGGRTWGRAQLRRELARAAWRQWRFDVPAGADRELRLVVRATDGTGEVQTEVEVPPHPTGASGLDSRTVRALPEG